MKIPKTVLQGIAVAIVVTATVSSCTKTVDFINPDKTKMEQAQFPNNCPACGLG